MLAELDALNEKINAERSELKQAAIHEIRVDMLAYGITVLDIARAMGIKRWKVTTKAKK